jgi:hypothetical protein
LEIHPARRPQAPVCQQLLSGKQLSFWGGFLGTFRAYFDRPGAPSTPYRKVVVKAETSSSYSIGQKTILVLLGIGILAWVAIYPVPAVSR